MGEAIIDFGIHVASLKIIYIFDSYFFLLIKYLKIKSNNKIFTKYFKIRLCFTGEREREKNHITHLSIEMRVNS